MYCLAMCTLAWLVHPPRGHEVFALAGDGVADGVNVQSVGHW